MSVTLLHAISGSFSWNTLGQSVDARCPLIPQPTTPEEILSLSHIIKDGKSSGCDDINPSIAQTSLPYMVQPLSHIVNLLLSTGVVPSKLKVAKVTPILKSSDPAEFSNYRPISVLTTFSKILEKLVHLRLTKFIDNHTILTHRQFGFRPKYSTETALIDLNNRISTSINNKEHTHGIF